MADRRQRRRKGEGAELRDEIIAAAGRLLADTGDGDQLTIRAVADAVGVTPPSIYLHFADKQQLLHVLLAKGFREFGDHLAAAATGAADPADALRRRCHAYLHFAAERPGLYRALFSGTKLGPAALGLDSAEPHPGADAFETLVAGVREAGGGRHAEDTAFALWAMLHGLADLRITKPEMPWPPAKRLIDRTLRQLIE